MFFDTGFSARMKLALAATTALALTATGASAASLVRYDFAGNAGNEAVEAASFDADNLTGLDFARGSGLATPSAGNAFNSASWGVYSENPDDYLTFGFNIAAGFTATVDELVFSSRSSNTGPGALAVLAAVDGGVFQQVASFTQSGDGVVNRMLAVTPLSALSSVVFRIVATSDRAANGTTLAGGGTFRVQNYAGTPAGPFSINGSVAPLAVAAVPEPATWAMMIAGFGLVGGALRRRTTKVAYAA